MFFLVTGLVCMVIMVLGAGQFAAMIPNPGAKLSIMCLAPAVLTYMLGTELKSFRGHVDSQEIGLPVRDSGLMLPCGASGRWEAD